MPIFKNIHPDVVSYSLIPIGILTAILFFYAPSTPFFYLIGALFILLRMIVGTLDGLIAVTFNKSSPKGEMINRIAPEVCDMLLITAIVYSSPNYLILGSAVLAACWAVTFFGLIGIVAEKKIQSVGPAGQTDRIVALAVFSLFHYFQKFFSFHIDFIYLFLIWVLVGSALTLYFRISRNFSR
ncbi:MAG: CDP-alcohol phosphatidyltransferase family protein [Candidatus Algichlamydia australiensis]|nr:CDP-alcohol phosphatidyltransferase family protein [Chlamydiales bacterium]